MENEELVTLKILYDELWSDARIMVKDMNKGISMVFLYGLTLLALVPMELSTAVRMYERYGAGSTRLLDYVYLVGGALGTIIAALAGISMIRWYFRLKNRYSKLIELEKTLGD